MNFRHAIGFMIVGAVLGLLPGVAPGWCPPTGVDGSSTRALWLELMSTVLITIAMVTFARRILASIATLLERGPAVSEDLAPAFELPVSDEGARALTARRLPARMAAQRTGLAMGVPFGSALLEPRRAA